MKTSAQRQHVTKKFVHFASQVSSFFPELDLRFNLQGNSNTVRYSIPDICDNVFEVTLSGSVDEHVHEAAFAIKEATGRFDA